MSKLVLDASVILAILGDEAGIEPILERLHEAVVSAVNFAEAEGKLVGRGIPPEKARAAVLSVTGEVVSFDAAQAHVAAGLLKETRALGLSLGDRACLALGVVLKAPVYTMDPAWRDVQLSIPIHLRR